MPFSGHRLTVRLAYGQQTQETDDAAPQKGGKRHVKGGHVVNARTGRGLPFPGEIEEKPHERLEERARTRHHRIDKADAGGGKAWRMIFLGNGETNDLGRAEETDQKA